MTLDLPRLETPKAAMTGEGYATEEAYAVDDETIKPSGGGEVGVGRGTWLI